jgi:hypothetical protein
VFRKDIFRRLWEEFRKIFYFRSYKTLIPVCYQGKKLFFHWTEIGICGKNRLHDLHILLEITEEIVKLVMSFEKFFA